MNMNFASVILPSNKKDKNVAVVQLEKGMAQCNLMKSENVSKYLEDLLVAEKKASTAKLGLHSKKAPPQTLFVDLVHNTKQAKDYE